MEMNPFVTHYIHGTFICLSILLWLVSSIVIIDIVIHTFSQCYYSYQVAFFFSFQ